MSEVRRVGKGALLRAVPTHFRSACFTIPRVGTALHRLLGKR
jgi:hypothetical protein